MDVYFELWISEPHVIPAFMHASGSQMALDDEVDQLRAQIDRDLSIRSDISHTLCSELQNIKIQVTQVLNCFGVLPQYRCFLSPVVFVMGPRQLQCGYCGYFVTV